MKPSFKPLLALIDRGLLCSAARLVPGARRADWLREWRAELWHVRQERAPMEQLSWQAEREIASFCLLIEDWDTYGFLMKTFRN